MTIDSKQETKPGRRALGRGLAALIPEADYIDINNVQTKTVPEQRTTNAGDRSFFMCNINELIPSTQQPRQQFDDIQIQELSESIKENGIIQPLIVRKRGNSYEIVAGERRWRASKIAGIKEVPVVLKEMSDRITLQTALVENIQRSDLNSIEEAKAYKQLIEEYGMTQDELSKKVGKERSSVSNYLRLLKLPSYTQDYVVKGDLSTGHAKVLCGLESEENIKKATAEIIKKSLSVRETEKLIDRLINDKKTNKNNKDASLSLFDSIEDSLRERFKTKVQVKGKYEKGSFVINYFSKDDFERILSILFE
jgi:ParB family transcriptional regulator, chromosome partitioning protein